MIYFAFPLIRTKNGTHSDENFFVSTGRRCPLEHEYEYRTVLPMTPQTRLLPELQFFVEPVLQVWAFWTCQWSRSCLDYHPQYVTMARVCQLQCVTLSTLQWIVTTFSSTFNSRHGAHMWHNFKQFRIHPSQCLGSKTRYKLNKAFVADWSTLSWLGDESDIWEIPSVPLALVEKRSNQHILFGEHGCFIDCIILLMYLPFRQQAVDKKISIATFRISPSRVCASHFTSQRASSFWKHWK